MCQLDCEDVIVEMLILISLRRTAVGIYALRLLQPKRSGRLGPRAVLALGCCGGSDPDFWDVWTRNQDREIDWSMIASDWQSNKE